jgi:F420-non-reducing hydrogenase iron-sulfur subunit
MCTGRVDLSFPLRAFLNGADGVFIGGCWPGECHYITEGNYDALGSMHLARRLMEHVGINPKRLRLEWVAASEGTRFAEVMNDFTNQLEEMGPLGVGEGLDRQEMKEGLESVNKMIPQLKMLAREKLQVRVKTEEAFEKLFASRKTQNLLARFLDDPSSSADELPGYYIDPEKCVACLICKKKCPIQGIAGEKKSTHVIDQSICTQCGTCFHSCPEKIRAVRKIEHGQPMPPDLPEDERVIVKIGAKK